MFGGVGRHQEQCTHVKNETDFEKTMQQYMDNVATSFDSSNLPPETKKLCWHASRSLASSVTDVEQMKLDGERSHESINTLKTSNTNNIQELEEKIKELEGKLEEERTSLRILESLESKNADFFTNAKAVAEAITESSSSFEDVVAKGEALRIEIAKRLQQMEEDRGLPAPLQAMRSLIAAYPINE